MKVCAWLIVAPMVGVGTTGGTTGGTTTGVVVVGGVTVGTAAVVVFEDEDPHAVKDRIASKDRPCRTIEDTPYY